MADLSEVTLLRLSPIDIPPYSARGITQTFEHIAAAASMRRTVNGALVDLSVPELRKYKSKITCRDLDLPALDGAWPGRILTVDCVFELNYLDSTDGPSRTVVSGSEYTENGFVFYRPQLIMRIISFNGQIDEWERNVAWTLDLEEV